jgi:AmmeMemoRadiSam system protein B
VSFPTLIPSVRYPIVAGSFYPSDPDSLRAAIEESFKHPLGPGSLPSVSEKRDKSIIGYVSPHAGYIYSGPVAAHVYYDLARAGKPETIIIIGTNHTGLGSLVSVYPKGRWATPLGELEVDEELARTIVNNSSYAELDVYAHEEEHSVEVQLPFIQYIYGDSVRITPIVLALHNPQVADDLARSTRGTTPMHEK